MPMKKRLLQRSALLALFLAGLLGKAPEAKAQAYDMIYRDTLTAVGTGIFSHSFSFYLYQNCNPVPVNFSNMPVHFDPGNGSPINEILTGPLPVVGPGNPFCATQSPVCSATGPLNFQKSGATYTFTTKANYSVPGFYTSSTEFTPYGVGFGNFQAANISGNFGIDPRVLKNITVSNIATPVLINRPPEFINPPVIFANVNQPVSYSSGAIDADGDSLVYRLRPISSTATYASGFTYLNPITANPALVLNARTGVLTFKPTAYDPTAGPGATANKYIVGIDVDEYRKANGGYGKIGTMQRNLLVNIYTDINNSPTLVASQFNPASQTNIPVAPNAIVDAFPGSQIRLDFGVSDPDLLDVVVPISNATTVFPGATLTITLGSNPNNAVLSWTPTTAHVRDEPYFFNVTARDNACPYPASITHTYGIRVRNILGLAQDRGASVFLAYPNPASGDVNFKLNAGKAAREILIFNLLGQEIDRIPVGNLPGGEQNIRWEKANAFAAGTYVAKLVSEAKTVQTLKFTKLQ
jgi:hypothetical protein